jgi:glycosyltransferase involved in cell wall biosynthesis
MYPGLDDPDLGVFVQRIEARLLDRGHDVRRATINRRRAGVRGNLRFLLDTVLAARSFRPDVVYAHFLAPAGFFAGIASVITGAPLVVTAHGQDVENIRARARWARPITRWVIRHADAVVAVSDFLASDLSGLIPEAQGRLHVINCGVDLDTFAPRPAPRGPASVLVIASLIERKNVIAIADAFASVRQDGELLVFAGEGDLRADLESRPDVHLLGAVAPDRIPLHIANARVVCLASKREPLGQALLEGMACGRTVVATNVGGPPEFVTDDAGVLVDPSDPAALVDALRTAMTMPCPNDAAREAAMRHDIRTQVELIEGLLERVARQKMTPSSSSLEARRGSLRGEHSR